MPVKRARPLADLYGDVAEYDLVLTADAPLASALNRRLDRPQLGTFAVPPRRLAAGRREQAEDRLAFLQVIDETDLDWKATAYAIGNVLQCWEYQGHIDAILDYDRYADHATRQVVEVMREMDTTSRRLTEYEVGDDRSVAVVGHDLLTPLERTILPDEYDQFSPFADGAFDLPQFHVFGSAAQIVDELLDVITTENADDVAVIIDQGSQYSTLVESGLEAAGIPFYGGPGFVDDPEHRAFLQLLRAGHAGSDVRVGDVRPVLTRLGASVPTDHDRKRLHDLDHEETEWIVEFARRIDGETFGEALSTYESRCGVSLDAFRAELRRLGTLDEPVTQSALDRLTFYLQTYEVPVDRENAGVLLADAKSAAYVDRPTVFYLGIDKDWTHSSPRRPWVDEEEEFRRNLGQFQLLIQNGREQYYLVQDAEGGRPVTPCFYFDELLEESFERFSDLDSVRHSRRVPGGGSGFDREPVAAEPESIETISQSSLNTYVNCPRDYFFDRLVDGPEQDRLTEGTLFHDFAEFYAHHPAFVDEDVIEEVVESMLERTRPFHSDAKRDLKRTEYRVGLETIVAFIDDHPPERSERADPDGRESRRGAENTFAEWYGRPVDSDLTEQWFENADLGVKGLIDLVRRPDHLVDHKSGRKKRASTIVRRAATDPPDDSPNFQAPLYLTHQRSVESDRELEFTFFHFLEAKDEAITDGITLDDTRTTVTYYPVTFDEHAMSRAAYETLVDHYNDCQATFEALGPERYREIMGDLSFPETTDREELRDSEFATRFTEAVDSATPADIDADVEKGCDQAIRRLNRSRRYNFFADDLDRFEAFVAEQLEQLNEYRTGAERFPVEGPAGEPNYRYVDNRELILEDD